MNNYGNCRSFASNRSYDWRQAPFVNKVESPMSLPFGNTRTLPSIQREDFFETKEQKSIREQRRLAVRKTFQRTWQSYREYAWTDDEIHPVSGTGGSAFGGWGATLVDSLDTLWIMGFKNEFYEAVEAVAAVDFGKTNVDSISVFETTIRYLGGLLSAYDLSGVPVLLEQAIQVGEMLYRAFDTLNNTPLASLPFEDAKHPKRREFLPERNICLACFGSLSMEFTRLAQITSQPKFYDAVARVTEILRLSQNLTAVPGLWPISADLSSNQFDTERTFSIGAQADSAYEYFPKMFALLGGLEPVYETLYESAAAVIDKYMLFRPMTPNAMEDEDLLLCGDLDVSNDGNITFSPRMQHLTCFIGGMFALSGRLFSNTHHVSLGAKLTKGCIHGYSSMPSGIMPESYSLVSCSSRSSCDWDFSLWEEELFKVYPKRAPQTVAAVLKPEAVIPGVTEIQDKRYLLRPEAIESVFIMYRVTGEQFYQDAAWNMFKAITSATSAQHAYGQLHDVTFSASRSAGRIPGIRDGVYTRDENIEDKMESFWTAETLKYFYLVFSDLDMISLDEWVLNTEAHPFKRPKGIVL